MELLDDNISLGADSLTIESIEAKIAVKKKFSIAQKNFRQARITAGIVAVLTIITVLISLSSEFDSQVGIIEIGLILIYISAVVIPIEYSKYSFTLISVLYLANLVLAIASFTGGMLTLVVLIRLIISYFLIKGAYSGFKIEPILAKMKSLDMKVYAE